MGKDVTNRGFMSTITSSRALREALRSLPQDLFQTTPPPPQFIYVPPTHVRALDPDNMLVVGTRGSGKSFWSQVLLVDDLRKVAALHVPSLQRGVLQVSPGWAEAERVDYPNRDTLASLCQANYESRHIWKTILLFQVARSAFEERGLMHWADRVSWVVQHPEDVAEVLRAADDMLVATNSRHLVVLDALDHIADAWEERQALVRGLLQLLLDTRSLRAIRAKAFLRPDLIADPSSGAFVDASKVLSSRVELTWSRLDLYALLWQYLGNAPEGADAFRALVSGWTSQDGVFLMPDALRRDETTQRALFGQFAGNTMGANERRAHPYTWIPTHLADAERAVTPRSFIAALRTAVDETPDVWTHAIHWKGIHSGVHKASEYQIAELAKDFPWIHIAMQALEGIQVPCNRENITSRWASREVLAEIMRLPHTQQNRQMALGEVGLFNDLCDIGVLKILSDGYYNVPEIYRVGFGIKRKGGVPQIKKL